MRIPQKSLALTLIALFSILFLFGVPLGKVNAQLNSKEFNGTIESNGAVWHNIYDVKQNDLVLISISGSGVFDSELLFPNLTVCKSIDFSSMHIYELNAAVSGNYLLRLNSWNGQSATYSISSSHAFNNETKTTTLGKSTPFEVPSNYVSENSTANFIYYFGDNTSVTTRDRTATHTYNETGYFTIIIMIQNNSGDRIVQSSTVIVNTPAGIQPTGNNWQIISIVVTVIGIVVATTTAVFLQRRREKMDKQREMNRQREIEESKKEKTTENPTSQALSRRKWLR